MFDGTIEPDPHPTPADRALYGMRDGHRREFDARKDRKSLSFPERYSRALTDVDLYGCVSFRELAETRFGGHIPTPLDGPLTRGSARGSSTSPQPRDRRAIRRVRLDGELKGTSHTGASPPPGERRPTGCRRRTASCGRGVGSAHQRPGPGALSRCTDRVHRSRRTDRPRQYRVASGHYRAPSIRAKANTGFRLSRERSCRETSLSGSGRRRRPCLHPRTGPAGLGRSQLGVHLSYEHLFGSCPKIGA